MNETSLLLISALQLINLPISSYFKEPNHSSGVKYFQTPGSIFLN
jgi:hypothetical protein